MWNRHGNWIRRVPFLLLTNVHHYIFIFVIKIKFYLYLQLEFGLSIRLFSVRSRFHWYSIFCSSFIVCWLCSNTISGIKMMLHNEWRKFILFVIPFYYPLSTWASFPFHRVSSLERLNGGIHSNNGNSFVYAVFCLALCVRLKNTWMRFWEFTKVLFTSEEYGWLPNIYLFISSIFIHLQHNGELDVSCMKCILFQLRYTAAPIGIRCNRARNIPEL